MCLLHTHHADTDFTPADITDFYTHNPDGLGVMWVTPAGTVETLKTLPKNAAEAWDFYAAHIKGKECACHWRMKTHGLIDMENCHPYEVLPGLYLMHNGILHTGNDKDRTKSDTWHFSADILRPQLERNPGLLSNQAWLRMLGGFIGSNRFIIMDADGQVIVNEQQGTAYKGAWMSNTYAWSAPNTYARYSASAATPSSYNYAVPPTQYATKDWWEVDGLDTSGDVDIAVEYLYEVLDNAALWGAYNRLKYPDVEHCYMQLGYQGFYDFCDMIMDMNLKNEDVEWLVLNPNEIFLTDEV